LFRLWVVVCFRKLDMKCFFKAGFEYLGPNKMATELSNQCVCACACVRARACVRVCACVMWERNGWCCAFVHIQFGRPPLQLQVLICVFACMCMSKGESWC